MTERDRGYTLGGVINTGIARRLAVLHTAMPGRVVRYDETKGQADVLPLVMVSYLDEAGATQIEALPVVPNVPVMFPGAGGFRITFPVKADDQTGDTVLLMFSEVSLDAWLNSGANNVDPLDERRFHLSDGIAILGLRDFVHALGSAPTDRMTVGDDAGLQLHIDKMSIRIGANDAPSLDTTGLGGAIATGFANVLAWLAAHTHAGVTTGPGTSGVSATPPPSIPNVQSGKVMVAK